MLICITSTSDIVPVSISATLASPAAEAGPRHRHRELGVGRPPRDPPAGARACGRSPDCDSGQILRLCMH